MRQGSADTAGAELRRLHQTKTFPLSLPIFRPIRIVAAKLMTADGDQGVAMSYHEPGIDPFYYLEIEKEAAKHPGTFTC